MGTEDHAIVAYGRYYGSEEFGSEGWFREVLAVGGVDLVITSYFYWTRKMPGAAVFVSGRGEWRIFLHVPDANVSTWMYELENYTSQTYYKGHAVTYTEAARDILTIVRQKGAYDA